MTFPTAAALVVNYQTAHLGLTRRGRLKEGETVLVHGAAGGVGTAAIQVAKALGAGRVVGVARGDEKRAAAEAAGADHTIDADEDWVGRVRELGGADVVVDPVGGDRFDQSLRCMAPEGRLLVVGFAEGRIPTLPVNRLLLRHLDVVGVNFGGMVPLDQEFPARAADDLFRWWQEGTVRPVVDDRYALEDGARCLTDFADDVWWASPSCAYAEQRAPPRPAARPALRPARSGGRRAHRQRRSRRGRRVPVDGGAGLRGRRRPVRPVLRRLALAPDQIVTAAHCAAGARPPPGHRRRRRARPARTDPSDPAVYRPVDDIYLMPTVEGVHPDDTVALNHDVAVLVVSDPVVGGTPIAPVEVPVDDTRWEVGDELEIAGWGVTEDGGFPTELQKATRSGATRKTATTRNSSAPRRQRRDVRALGRQRDGG